MCKHCGSWLTTSLRNKRFRGVGEQRKKNEQDFDARTPFFMQAKHQNPIALNPTEMLATQATSQPKSQSQWSITLFDYSTCMYKQKSSCYCMS